MERITSKRKDGFYELAPNKEIYGWENGVRLVQIVGKLEDIKDELGIDLTTLFKVFVDGIWIKESCSYLDSEELERFKHKNSSYYDKENKLIFCPGIKADTEKVIQTKPALTVTLLEGKTIYYLITPIVSVLLKDYGKTWALTKEELE